MVYLEYRDTPAIFTYTPLIAPSHSGTGRWRDWEVRGQWHCALCHSSLILFSSSHAAR